MSKFAYLSVKVKSLAAESVIIRRDERKYRSVYKSQEDRNSERAKRAHQTFMGLKTHRREDVRRESRSATLALGFLRGTPYQVMEAKCWTQPDWTRVIDLVTKFGETEKKLAREAVENWYKAEPDQAMAA